MKLALLSPAILLMTLATGWTQTKIPKWAYSADKMVEARAEAETKKLPLLVLFTRLASS